MQTGGIPIDLSGVIGKLPYRMALAGGWIDQPFVSRLNPSPPGSMVVISLEPTVRFMDRCGMATGTRRVAARLWNGEIPQRNLPDLVRRLYAEENGDRPEPSGSQDMIGLLYPGISRLDYDAASEEGFFPAHIESTRDPRVVAWIERVFHLVAVNQRPPGYNPLGLRRLDPEGVARLGQTGKDCFDAIAATNIRKLGSSLNECMRCWEALLPLTVRHPTIDIDLVGLLNRYQERYPGAMYSGCGGGYLLVVAEEQVPGAFQIKVRAS